MSKIGAVRNRDSGTLPPYQKSKRIHTLGKEISEFAAPECVAIVTCGVVPHSLNGWFTRKWLIF